MFLYLNDFNYSVLQVNDYVLLALLLTALFFDLTQKKIPNFLTFPVILGGLFANTAMGRWEGFLFGFYGLLLGIALFFIPFYLGGMGGGDVKLWGAIGALQGMQFVFQTTLLTTLCGGILALGYLLVKGQLCKALKNILGKVAVPLFNALYFRYGYLFLNRFSFYFSSSRGNNPGGKVYLPYSLAIVLGALIVFGSGGGRIFSQAFCFSISSII